MLTNTLRVVHSVLIALICSNIASGYICSIVLVLAEAALTIARAVIEHGLFSRNTRFQILATLVLGYSLFPNKAHFISWAFFFKGIEVHKSLKKVRLSCFLFRGDELGKYLAFAFDVIRFSVNQFLFFGLVHVVYKYFLDAR